MCIKNHGQLLESYKTTFEKILKNGFEIFGEETSLRKACEYALLTGGKRLRPIITMMIASALDKGLEASYAALSVEFFHTSSLIADDMPCMDDDDLRRGKPTVHKMYGETTALLASFALISAGYQMIFENVKSLKASEIGREMQPDTLGMLAVENASYSTGILGITGGQFLDIYPPDNLLETIKDVVGKKTAALFETAFVFGWLFGGGGVEHLDSIKKAARHFGTAFQMLDDLGDVEQDLSNHHDINYAVSCGVEKTLTLFYEELQAFAKILEELDIYSEGLQGLVAFMTAKADEERNLAEAPS
ncbi:MAG: polyprenyl synthetase family protein [Chlamydiota bacterium]